MTRGPNPETVCATCASEWRTAAAVSPSAQGPTAAPWCVFPHRSAVRERARSAGPVRKADVNVMAAIGRSAKYCNLRFLDGFGGMRWPKAYLAERVSTVAQIGNLPYRRLAIGGTDAGLKVARSADYQSAIPPTASRRYIEALAHRNHRGTFRACFQIACSPAARDFGCGQGGEAGLPDIASSGGGSIPLPTCRDDGRANAGRGQKTRRPEGFRAKDRLASLLLAHRPLAGMLARHASPSGLFPENRIPRNFKTGS